MNTRFLELNSTYRNRTDDINPAVFSAMVAQSGTKEKYNAIDPISLAAPPLHVTCTPNNFSLVNPTGSTLLGPGTIAGFPIGYASSSTKFFGKFPIGYGHKERDYYVGATLYNSVPTPDTFARIKEWVYFSSDSVSDYFLITTEVSISFVVENSDSISIFNPTNLTLNPPVIFIPTGVVATNIYASYIIYNETKHQWRPISYYDGDTRLVTLNISSQYGGPITPPLWAYSDVLTLRQQAPQEYGLLSRPILLSPFINTLNTVVLPSSSSSTLQNYVGDFIRFTQPPLFVAGSYNTGDLVYYNNTTYINIIPTSETPPTSKWLALPNLYGEMRRITTYGNVVQAPLWKITTTYNIGSVVSYLGNGYVSSVANTGLQPNTNPASWTLYGPLKTSNPPTIFSYVAGVYPAFSSVPPAGLNYEILQFTRDNYTPFTYTGSTVSQQEMVCYEVELINLILPNVLLTTGSRIAYYPYVYVELQQVSGSGAGLTNIIYSNNPNSTKRLFRCAIDDIRDPTQSPFIKVDGDGMTQTIKFKPNDNFKFGVFLSDGRPFETVEKDTQPPVPPNPLLQISGLFSITRL